MDQGSIQRRVARRFVAFPLGLALAAPRLAGDVLDGATQPGADSTATYLLVFGLLGLAVASAAVAVRMVRRWH